MDLKPNEILELVRAGYTKDEISAMVSEPEPEKEPAAQDPVPEPETKPEPDKKKEDFSNVEEIINTKFAELQNMIQESNRKNVENPEPDTIPGQLDAITAAKQFLGAEK